MIFQLIIYSFAKTLQGHCLLKTAIMTTLYQKIKMMGEHPNSIKTLRILFWHWNFVCYRENAETVK